MLKTSSTSIIDLSGRDSRWATLGLYIQITQLASLLSREGLMAEGERHRQMPVKRKISSGEFSLPLCRSTPQTLGRLLVPTRKQRELF